ncbi:hypothetical protein QQF64_001698 [Cirrhinus molitorella]
MRSRDGGGGRRRASVRSVSSQSHPERLPACAAGRSSWGRGSRRRKENSARKKLKTKRKEAKEKFWPRRLVEHVERYG